jgi:hypothetical protein
MVVSVTCLLLHLVFSPFMLITSPTQFTKDDMRQFNVKYGQKFLLPMCWCYVEHLNSVLKYEHVDTSTLLSAVDFKLSQRRPFGTCTSYRPTKRYVLWMIIKFTKCSAEFGSTMPRLIPQRVKYFLLTREVWDAHNYLNWFIVHVLRCLKF